MAVREANLEHIPEILDRIIHLGGQVVRIGHPEMTDFEPRPGYIDLKSANFFLQAQAIGRSRCFFEVSPSGPASLAQAQGVPLARCNSVDLCTVRPELGFFAPKRVIHNSGKDLTLHLIETNQMNRRLVENHPDLEFQELQLPDLFNILDILLDMTSDSDNGWRDTTPPPRLPTIEGFYPGAVGQVPVSIYL